MSEAQPTENKKLTLGIALGGGGPLGGIYEIGALRAIDEALEGLDFNDLDIYVGVNSGSFVAANLANQMTPAQMCRIFVRNEADVHPFHPEVFYKPAFSEYTRRIKSIPKILLNAGLSVLSHPNDQSVLEALTALAQAIPSGIFDNNGFHKYLSRSYSSIGRTNEFEKLRKQLIVIAADLESGETVRFGTEGLTDLPISKAIQCSMAAPGIYKPVEVGGRYYVDGTLNKGMHTSVAFESGADIVFAINPVVPIDVGQAVQADTMKREELTQSGMPNVLSQAYRTMVHSRLTSGLKNISRDFPGKDVLSFEPPRHDANLFFSSVFSFNSRKMMCESAYQLTRANLRNRIDELEKVLAPAGVRVRKDILFDEQRTLSTGLYGEALPTYQGRLARPHHTDL
ncbi:patatin-like phospholipase family protein, partial [Oleiphilus sp. HI0117]|uniref:patatin-like phospholipase family protein n=1 Tax=Oleiphilus sp. HI0117 TaxID=1822261 RepID=UPI0007C382C8